MKRILVTGGAGFLGTNLTARLLGEGHRVVCLDNFTTGRMRNLAPLVARHGDRLTILRGDVTEPVSVDCDEIYHFACPASPPHYQADPVKTAKTSVLGALHLLDLATKNGAKILFASTSEVYGDPLEHPQKESYWGHVNPIGIRSCYDEGKRMAETLAMDYRRQYGTRAVLIRIFNTYGPHMRADDGRVVSNFICQALSGKPLTLYGDGSQTRSFTFVDDLIDGAVRMMNGPDEFAGPVNLGNPGEFTVRTLAEEVLKRIPGPSAMEFRPLPSDDPKKRKPDIALAKEKLGWEPKVALADGLDRTIPYFAAEMKEDPDFRLLGA